MDKGIEGNWGDVDQPNHQNKEIKRDSCRLCLPDILSNMFTTYYLPTKESYQIGIEISNQESISILKLSSMIISQQLFIWPFLEVVENVPIWQAIVFPVH